MPSSETSTGTARPSPADVLPVAPGPPPRGEEELDVLDFHLRLVLERGAASAPEDPIALWDSAI